jgi:hypothetical protein
VCLPAIKSRARSVVARVERRGAIEGRARFAVSVAVRSVRNPDENVCLFRCVAARRRVTSVSGIRGDSNLPKRAAGGTGHTTVGGVRLVAFELCSE